MDEVTLGSWEHCAAALQQCYAELGRRLTLGEILPELFSLGIITDYEKHEIEDASRTENARNLKLVDFLLKKGKREFEQFLHALDKVGRADLLDLLIVSLKAKLSVHKCIVVRILSEDADLPSVELVSLWLEQEIGMNVEKAWLLEGKRCIMVRCGHDRDRQKALNYGNGVIDYHKVAFEVPDFLNTVDRPCEENGANVVTFTRTLTDSAVTVLQPIARPSERDTWPSAETREPCTLSSVRTDPGDCSRVQPSDCEIIPTRLSRNRKDDVTLDALETSSSLQEQHQQHRAQRLLPATQNRIESDGAAVDIPLENTHVALPESDASSYLADVPDAVSHNNPDNPDLNIVLATSKSHDENPLVTTTELSLETSAAMSIKQENYASDDEEHALMPSSHSNATDSDNRFVRLVFGENLAASQYISMQDDSFLSLLKDINCSVPMAHADWGNLLVLDYLAPICLPRDQSSLCHISTAIHTFFAMEDARKTCCMID